MFILLHIIKIVDIWYRNYIMWFILPLTHPSWVQQHSNFQNCCSKKNKILSPWSPISTYLGLKWPYQVIDSDEQKEFIHLEFDLKLTFDFTKKKLKLDNFFGLQNLPILIFFVKSNVNFKFKSGWLFFSNVMPQMELASKFFWIFRNAYSVQSF